MKKSFDDSNILKDIFNKWFVLKLLTYYNKKVQVTRIYRASEDGWKPANFHQHCADKGETLILFKTLKNKIIGGFNAMNWGSGNSYQSNPANFIFSVDLKAQY